MKTSIPVRACLAFIPKSFGISVIAAFALFPISFTPFVILGAVLATVVFSPGVVVASDTAPLTSATNLAQTTKTDKIDEAILKLDKIVKFDERDKATTEARRILEEIQKKVAELEGRANATSLQQLKGEAALTKAKIKKYAADKETLVAELTRFYINALNDLKLAYQLVEAASPSEARAAFIKKQKLQSAQKAGEAVERLLNIEDKKLIQLGLKQLGHSVEKIDGVFGQLPCATILMPSPNTSSVKMVSRLPWSG